MDKPTLSDQQIADQKQNTEDRLALEAVDAMCQFARDQFKALDKNRDGYLTKIELEEAASSGKYNGQELKQLRVLAENAGEIQKAVHHTWTFKEDNLGMAWRDLSETQSWAKQKIQRLEDYRAFRDTFNRNFAKIDTDGNKSISYYELQTASKSFAFERGDRQNLADAFYKWYLITDKPGLFSARVIPENYFDNMVKAEEDRNSPKWHQKMLWSMADRLRK